MGSSASSRRGAQEEWEDNYKDGPPWIFKGRALYQLQLVKASVAREFIPKELKIVEAFGYTLGGLYFAQYDSSPAGRFDELVALAGIVWNPPTSCAWAARVLVDTPVAVTHGLTEVGLPSQLARFEKHRVSGKSKYRHRRVKVESQLGQPPNEGRALDVAPLEAETAEGSEDGQLRVTVDEVLNRKESRRLAAFTLPKDRRKGAWAGPHIKMFLPSFSGRSKTQPDMLKYSCELRCNVRPVPAAAVEIPTDSTKEDPNSALQSVLRGRPILSIMFDNMHMSVEKPVVISTRVDSQKVLTIGKENKGEERKLVPAFGALRWGKA